jgi:hypothetical protein
MLALRLAALAALVLALAGAAHAQRPEAEGPLRILFVGNSLTATNDLPALVGRPFRLNRPGFRLTVPAARAKLLRAAAREALRAA